MGRWSRRVAPRFLTWLDLDDGLRWADLGCGSGALSATVLDRASPASVHGVDPSAAQVEEAVRRVVDPRVSFTVGTADDLPAGAFDVVVSGLVLNFVPDPTAAVSAMARAAPGGVVAAYVWDYTVGMQLLRTFWDVACSIDPAAADLNEGHRFSWSSAGEVAGVLAAGGLRDVVSTDLTVPLVFEDFNDYWLPFLGGQGPAPGYVATLDDDAREVLRAALEQQLIPGPDGRIRMSARAWGVRGTA
jgi:trans-aconitate methyltransferase